MLNKIKAVIVAGLLMVTAVVYGAELRVATVTGDVQYRVEGASEMVPAQVDDKIPEGAFIRVSGKEDSIFLEMPDGSEIQLIGVTAVSVDALLQDGKKTGFKLFSGKLFAKVNKKTKQDFTVETDNAVAAVRGTSFGVLLSGGVGDVVVQNGSVELQDPTGANPPVMIGAGMFSSFAPGAAFTVPKLAPNNMFSQFGQTAPANTDSGSTDSGTTDSGTIDTGDPNVDMSGGDTEGADSSGTEENKAPLSDECSSAGFHWSVASETIEDDVWGTQVWNKVLLSPTMKLGNVTLSLYLPLYFQNLEDLAYRERWYNGDEWNFGFFLPNTQFDFIDFMHDLVLKIRYMGYKSPEGKETQILFRVGSMPNMSIAHGLLIDNYANDIEFPAERKVGLQYNMDFGKFGFETLIGDIFNLQMAGLHLFFRPFHGKPIIGKMSFGLSLFGDYDPTGSDTGSVFGYAADMMYPIINLLGTSVNLYAEGGTLGYQMPGEQIHGAKGLGVNAGVKGTILGLIDYKAEYRHTEGGFDVGYVNAFYDVTRSSKIYSLVNNASTNYDGFMIEAGKTWEKVGGLSLKFEQLFPSIPTSVNAVVEDPNNYLHIELWVDKCLFKKAYGKIMYDRENFAPDEFFGKNPDGTSRFFSDAVITTQIFYEVAADSYIGVTYKNFYDENGNKSESYGLETTMGI